jgi:formate-dependent phosphoribosylglycinamide formyltransferase (GAR transformylase)
MDNNKMPEPVAWRCNWNRSGEIAWVEYRDETDPLPEKWDAPPNETLPLYSAETVQTLQAECEEQARLNGMGAEREARLMAQVAELRAERDALAKDAARYRWLRDTQNSPIRGDEEYSIPGTVEPIFVSTGDGVSTAIDGEDLDAAIDAAMAEGER